jgi:hypothetical protein
LLPVTSCLAAGGQDERRAEADVRLGRDGLHICDAAEPVIDPAGVVAVQQDAGRCEVGGHDLGGVLPAGC